MENVENTIHNLCQYFNLSTDTELKAEEYKNLIENGGKTTESFPLVERMRDVVAVYVATMKSPQISEYRSLVVVAKNTNTLIPALERGYFITLHILKLKVYGEKLKKFQVLANYGVTQESIGLLCGTSESQVRRTFRKYNFLTPSKSKKRNLKEAIKMLHSKNYSDNGIVKELGVSHHIVKKIRKEYKLPKNSRWLRHIHELQELANCGVTQEEIGVLYGVGKNTIHHCFKKYGIYPNRGKKNKRVKNALLKMCSKGYSDNQISKELEVSHGTVSRIRKEMNIPANYPKRWFKGGVEERELTKYILPLWEKGVSEEEMSYRLNLKSSEVTSIIETLSTIEKEGF